MAGKVTLFLAMISVAALSIARHLAVSATIPLAAHPAANAVLRVCAN